MVHFVSSKHQRVYVFSREEKPNIVKPEGHVENANDRVSLIDDETWVIVNGHIVKEVLHAH